MTTQKHPSAILTCIFLLALFLSLSPTNVIAADPEITGALDEIGQKYEINNSGDIFLTFNINNNETTVDFTVKPLGDKGDMAFIYSGAPEQGVNSMICRLTSQCRGEKLKSVIDSFINASYAFQITQRKNASKAKAPMDELDAIVLGSPELTDFNIIPTQYRESNSKVTAWLKQQGFEGKPVSIKATVSSVGSARLDFKYEYDAGNGAALRFDAEINNYSPLDYNEGETYIINGQMTMPDYGFWPFTISQATLQIVK